MLSQSVSATSKTTVYSMSKLAHYANARITYYNTTVT